MAGPIVRISCDKEVEFQKPVTLQVPLSLREKPDFPDSSLVRARVLFQQSEGEHREWTEITESLEFPPSFDETAIRFKVRHFSGYAKAVLLCVFILCILHLLDGTTLFMYVTQFYQVHGQVFRLLLNRHDSKLDTLRESDRKSFKFRVMVSLYLRGNAIRASSDNRWKCNPCPYNWDGVVIMRSLCNCKYITCPYVRYIFNGLYRKICIPGFNKGCKEKYIYQFRTLFGHALSKLDMNKTC